MEVPECVSLDLQWEQRVVSNTFENLIPIFFKERMTPFLLFVIGYPFSLGHAYCLCSWQLTFGHRRQEYYCMPAPNYVCSNTNKPAQIMKKSDDDPA